MLEKPKVGAQLDDAERRKAVHDHVLLHEEMFRRQGVVAATWRVRSGTSFGPYYRLVFRDEGRKRSIYLGRSVKLAGEVRALLAGLQAMLRSAGWALSGGIVACPWW